METFKQYTIRALQVQVSLRLDKEAEGYPTGRYIILLGWRKATSFLRARTHTGIYFETRRKSSLTTERANMDLFATGNSTPGHRTPTPLPSRSPPSSSWQLVQSNECRSGICYNNSVADSQWETFYVGTLELLQSTLLQHCCLLDLLYCMSSCVRLPETTIVTAASLHEIS